MALKPVDTSRRLDVHQSSACAEKFKALGEPIRLRIVDLLRQGELTVSEIAEVLATEVVTISHHLQILKNAQLVTSRRDGRFVHYSLSSELLPQRGKSWQWLDLGCCSIEIPSPSETN